MLGFVGLVGAVGIGGGVFGERGARIVVRAKGKKREKEGARRVDGDSSSGSRGFGQKQKRVPSQDTESNRATVAEQKKDLSEKNSASGSSQSLEGDGSLNQEAPWRPAPDNDLISYRDRIRYNRLMREELGEEVEPEMVPPLSSTTADNSRQQEAVPEARPPLVLNIIGIEQQEELRLKWTDNFDEILLSALSAEKAGRIGEWTQANYAFLSFAFFYRMTSILLKAEIEGESEKASTLRNVRGKLLRICDALEEPWQVHIKNAESRVATTIQSDNVSRAAQQNQGRSKDEINAFWVVLYAAIAAWEGAAESRSSPVRKEVVAQLKAAIDVVNKDDAFQTSLQPEIRVLQGILTASTEQEQRSALDFVDEAVLLAWGILANRLRKLALRSYGDLFEKLTSILHAVVSERYGVVSSGLRPVTFDPPDYKGVTELDRMLSEVNISEVSYNFLERGRPS